MTNVALATEDELSESVGRRLLAEANLHPSLLLRRNGVGYLKSHTRKWCDIVNNGLPLVLIADLDRCPCAASQVDLWFRDTPKPQNLVFRIAVREIESWLLADHTSMAHLLGTRVRLPPEPDVLADPKQHLLNLALKAPRAVRNALTAPTGSPTKQGIEYNNVLSRFVLEEWDPKRGARVSPSLLSAIRRLRELKERLT